MKQSSIDMSTLSKPPIWFWIVAGVLVLWNAMGAFAYISDVTKTTADLAAMPAVEAELYQSVPIWAKSAYAIAVWFGLAGAILLLLRKSWATPVFLLSLLGIIVQQIHIYFLSNNLEVYGTEGLFIPVTVLVLGLFAVFFSRSARSRRWIG